MTILKSIMIELIYYGIVYLFLVQLFLTFLLNIFQNKTSCTTVDNHHDYFFIVPCVNEELVIYQTISSLLAIDKNCHIIAIDDGSTDNTYNIMQQFPENRCTIIKRELPNARQGKGVALNAALQWCIQEVKKRDLPLDSVIVGVIDADGKLSHNAMNELNRAFSEKDVAAVQMRVKMYDDFKNTLQVAQDLEFFTVNNLIQKARVSTNSVGLSGNGQFFRLGPILETIGPNPWGTSLLDDYELTLKLMSENLKIAYVSNAYVYQEALSSTKLFIKQRSRWVQGNLDCLKYIRQVSSSTTLTSIQKLSIFYFLSQPFINLIATSCILIFSIKSSKQIYNSLPIIYENTNHYLFLFFIILGFSIIFGIIFTVLYDKNLSATKEIKPPFRFFLLLPFATSYMYLILFFSILIAFWRQLSNQRSWIKTKRN